MVVPPHQNMTEAEFRDHVVEKMTTMQDQVSDMQAQLSDTKRIAQETKDSTKEVVEAYKTLDGGIRALESIYRIGKPLLWMAGVGSSTVAGVIVIWSQIKGWDVWNLFRPPK